MSKIAITAAAVFAAAASAQQVSGVLTLDVSGTQSFDGPGAAGNTVLMIDMDDVIAGSVVDGSVEINGLGWDVTIEAFSPSYLAEAVVAYENSSQSAGVFLSPGINDPFSGTGVYSSSGVLDLIGLGFNFNLDADNMLRIEFFEDFDDFPGAVDGEWLSGTLDIAYTANIPAPGAAAMVAFGGVIAGRRRR